ncbi:MAG: type II toxin-antitoxin system HicB family antitoxin [Spirochaetaceae bacterium]|jgi:predicted RNase H-like HicB family nuclease|nr:type II toxin-antitoxin system HicB family antitoxin [Spirochaetaceae bacterium]
MEYVYPAVFHKNEDKSYTVIYPDLPGCISEGKKLGNAMYMAQAGLVQWITYLADKKLEIPQPSSVEDVEIVDQEFVNLICAEVKDNRAVKRTVSIPKWMDEQAVRLGLSLSRVLQDALIERLA